MLYRKWLKLVFISSFILYLAVRLQLDLIIPSESVNAFLKAKHLQICNFKKNFSKIALEYNSF